MSKYDSRQYNDSPATRVPPPLAEGVLQDMLRRARKMHKYPKSLPYDIHEAALRWLRLQEPERPKERPEWIWKHGTDAGGSWNVPYVDRVANTLSVFMKMKHAQQEFIIENTEAGYPWRGDSIAFYKEVIEQYKIRDGYIEKYGLVCTALLPPEYTLMVMRAARSLARQMTGQEPRTTGADADRADPARQ